MCPKMLNAGVLIYLFLPWHHLITGSEGLAQPRVRSQRLHHRGGRGTGRRWLERRGPSSSSPGASTPGSPREKNTNCRGFQVFFFGKRWTNLKIQLITKLNPSSTKLTQKIKRNIAATKNHPKSPPKATEWELPAMAHLAATSASRWSGRGQSWHRWVLLVAAAGSMDCGPNSSGRTALCHRRRNLDENWKGGTQDLQTRSWTGLGSR